MKFLSGLVLCLLISGCSSPDLLVHLKIFDKRPFLRISAVEGLRIKADKQVLLTNNIIINSKILTDANIVIMPLKNSEILEVNSDIPVKKYHGRLLISLKNGFFRVFNLVSEEHYLASVIGSEMDESFPLQAREAQAVVSRTLLYYLMAGRRNISDLSSEFQAYRGADFETEGTIRAVHQTAGIVLKYKQKLFYPFFHSTCGGILLPAEMRRDIPPGFYPGIKEPKPDEYGGVTNCSDSPYFHWKTIIRSSEVERALGIRGIRSIQLVKSSGGWVSGVIINSGAKIRLAGYQFLNYIWKNTRGGVFSYIFNIRKSGDQFIFEGSGFGHHTGMCQWGARGLALRGVDYSRILKFYYPDTDLSRSFLIIN